MRTESVHLSAVPGLFLLCVIYFRRTRPNASSLLRAAFGTVQGEPLHNLEPVLAAVEVLCDTRGLAFGRTKARSHRRPLLQAPAFRQFCLPLMAARDPPMLSDETVASFRLMQKLGSAATF